MAHLGRLRRWSARHVPRSENRAADALANEALDRVAAGGPAVVVRRPGEGIRSEAAARLPDAPPDAADAAPGGAAAPRTRRSVSRDQMALGLEPGFDPGDPGPEAGELRVRILGSGHQPGPAPDRLRLRDLHLDDPRDRRLRASALLAWGARRVVIDCGPDFRAQALAADLDRLDAVLLSHDHQDAIGGLDDLRRFNEIAGDYLPVHGAAGDARGGRCAGSPTRSSRARRASGASRCCAPWPSRARSRSPAGASCPVPVIARRPARRSASGPAGSGTSPTSIGSTRRRWPCCATSTCSSLDALRDVPHPPHQTVDEALSVIAELRPAPGLPDPPRPRAAPRRAGGAAAGRGRGRRRRAGAAHPRAEEGRM